MTNMEISIKYLKINIFVLYLLKSITYICILTHEYKSHSVQYLYNYLIFTYSPFSPFLI